MKIGVVGLGDIFRKAYLPVTSARRSFEFHFFSRRAEVREQIAHLYGLNHLHESLESLLRSGISAAFVHSSTESHFEISKILLEKGIHVFVDKPFTYHYQQSLELVELAEAKSLILMAGFNRRHAPSYRALKEISNPNLILMQKNRVLLPDGVRRFILDDFIHVVDTIRFLFPYPLAGLEISGLKKKEQLYQVMIRLYAASGESAIGIMNRDSGVNEERVEVMSTSGKQIVENVSDHFIQSGKDIQHRGGNDWEPTLHKRGFEPMVDHFLKAVLNGDHTASNARDALMSHQICEQIVEKLGD